MNWELQGCLYPITWIVMKYITSLYAKCKLCVSCEGDLPNCISNCLIMYNNVFFLRSNTHTKRRLKEQTHPHSIFNISTRLCEMWPTVFSASAGKGPGEILHWGLESQCSHYVISPTRPVVYPCCCSLVAKVVSLAGSPPEPPRKSSTCTRPTLPIPDQDTHERI